MDRKDNPDMTITSERSFTLTGLGAAVTIVALPERLDIHEVEQLRHHLLQLELGRGHRVSFDASVVAHVDLAGLAFLEDAHWHAREVGADLSITNTNLALRLAVEWTGCEVPPFRVRDLLADPYDVAA